MIKISDLHEGDFVMANYDGQVNEGVVTDINHEDREICVKTDVQSFWFTENDLLPIVVNENQLYRLGFEKELYENEDAKYKKGPFRVLVHAGNFDDMEIWYREDHRLLKGPLFVHQLQHHYHQMTKVDLA